MGSLERVESRKDWIRFPDLVSLQGRWKIKENFEEKRRKDFQSKKGRGKKRELWE